MYAKVPWLRGVIHFSRVVLHETFSLGDLPTVPKYTDQSGSYSLAALGSITHKEYFEVYFVCIKLSATIKTYVNIL